ncbi:MAG: PRC-barrel domain containing protein [Gaiella sp.]
MSDVTQMHDVWAYRDRSELGSNVMDTQADLSGFKVEALDGSIGKVDEATYEMGRSHIIVDTGPWIFGKKVMLPAGVVRSIDETDEVVFVNRTKDQIKNAPEFDDSLLADDNYRSSIGTYYGRGGLGYRDWDDTL